MFGFQGGESVETRPYERRAREMAISDQLRLLDHQDRRAALFHGQNAVQHLGGAGEARCGSWMQGRLF